MLILFYSLAVTLFARLFMVWYQMTRKMERSALSFDRGRGRILLACVCMNLLLLGLADALKTKEILLLWLLLACIADIDLMILKIPTELLILLSVYTLSRLFPMEAHTLLLIGSGIVIGAAFFFTSGKTGISFYDILLIVLLCLQALSISAQLIFIAAFLVLWGTIGLITSRYKIKGERIPLAPVIVLALALVFRL